MPTNSMIIEVHVMTNPMVSLDDKDRSAIESAAWTALTALGDEAFDAEGSLSEKGWAVANATITPTLKALGWIEYKRASDNIAIEATRYARKA